ncbi:MULTISPECIES: SDR family NAD(P)-dependent oxidoreductase [Bradyrhizobium]|uniref:SDR family NAD(P)-dependent oxidoreductase n=1 Tax=Bradyrhizobium TaxID=374 RepID=UPI001FCE07A5|nr:MULTISPECIES: SDR family oxidoreductase [Bradyrhizobium]
MAFTAMQLFQGNKRSGPVSTKENERQCALVTGASGGIGLELARVLAAHRFDLVLLARSRDKLETLAGELKADHGARVTVVPADLSEPSAPQAVFDTLNDAGIQVGLLVNNAGLLIEGRFGELDLEDELRLLQVNVLAMTALTRLFLPPMLERKHGRILNVASIAAFVPVPNLAVYAASKAYVLSFGEALSQELSGSKITLTTLCPGVTETGMVQGTSLAGMPRMMIMDAKSVAQEGYRACMAGKPVHVAGIANELAVQWVKYQPNWLMRAVGGLLGKGRDA